MFSSWKSSFSAPFPLLKKKKKLWDTFSEQNMQLERTERFVEQMLEREVIKQSSLLSPLLRLFFHLGRQVGQAWVLGPSKSISKIPKRRNILKDCLWKDK